MNSSLQLCLNQLVSNVRDAGISRNAVVSPVSVRAAVAMLGAGCSGRSLDRVLDFFGLEKAAELKTSFSRSTAILNRAQVPFVTGAWIDKRRSFKPSYQDCLRDSFKAEAKTLDFINQGDEAVKDINSWVDNHTKGLIDNIIERVEPSTAVILGSALYFKGCWKQAFCSAEKDFYLEDGGTVSNAAFMTNSRRGTNFRHESFGDFEVVEIPCENRLTMQLVLPGKRDGLKDVLEKLIADPELLDFSKVGSHNQLGIWIPKFNFSYTLDDINLGSENIHLGEMLQTAQDQFDGIKVIQKVRVEVDENGTEAAANDPEASYRKGLSFVVDRPFMFLIKDTLTGLVLFAGTVMNPLQDPAD